jgi:hypothetical protein
MKKLVKVTEVDREGLEGLMGEYIVVWCLNYIYSGKLVGVNTNDILLDEAEVVYETGELTAKAFKLSQKLPGPWYVRTSVIESYGVRGF